MERGELFPFLVYASRVLLLIHRREEVSSSAKSGVGNRSRANRRWSFVTRYWWTKFLSSGKSG